jgi:hypothetical protein
MSSEWTVTSKPFLGLSMLGANSGGKVGMAFGETFWSPGYGSLTDKFGIPWMVNTSPAEGWTSGHG